MKKIYLALIAASMVFASCDMMEDGLSSDQKAEVARETGSAYAADSTYCYDGAVASDAASLGAASPAHASHLVIGFTQNAVAQSTGLTGSLTVSVKDAAGNTHTMTSDIAKSDVALKYLEGHCSVNMKDALGMIGASADGTGTITINMGGLVCAAGDQAGRNMPTFNKKIAIAPMWTSGDVASIATKSSTAGKLVILTLNGAAAAGEDGIKVESLPAPSAGALPAGLTAADFVFHHIGEDGKSIAFSCNKDLKDADFEGSLVVSGIKPLTSEEEYTHTFDLMCSPTEAKFCNNKALKSGYNLAVSSDVLKACGAISEMAIVVASDTTDDNGWASVAAGANWAAASGAGCYLDKTKAADGTTQWTWTITDAAQIAALVNNGLYIEAGSAATAVTVTATVGEPVPPQFGQTKSVAIDEATLGYGTAADVTVASADTGVATAAVVGGNIVITSVAAGSTTVTCSLAGATSTATIAVTVNAKTGKVSDANVTQKWVKKTKDESLGSISFGSGPTVCVSSKFNVGKVTAIHFGAASMSGSAKWDLWYGAGGVTGGDWIGNTTWDGDISGHSADVPAANIAAVVSKGLAIEGNSGVTGTVTVTITYIQ